jgi:serine/threonine-protein kinase RIO1
MLMASVMPVGVITTEELTMHPTATSLPSAQAMLPVPVLSGRLKIKSQIGDGSCSIVYKAYDAANQKMALKVYKPQCQWLAYSEAQLLHQYQHR